MDSSGMTPSRSLLIAAVGVLLTMLGLPGPAAGATGAPVQATTASTPLSTSNYSAEPVCGVASPGRASCMASVLLPRTAEARARTHPVGMTLSQRPESAGSAADGAFGLRPQDLHGAYELPTEASTAQTIALVDAYNDPTAEEDLKAYDEEFDLPPCTTANHCFSKVNQEGHSAPLPETEGDWALEISLDIETAHAICQNCHIMLVEASSSYTDDLEAAEQRAVEDGATEISNSYGGPGSYEGGGYNHPGVVITASTGDDGYNNWDAPYLGESANYPADSPDVIAVGGTALGVVDGAWSYETAWSEGGSGCSPVSSAPSWQLAVPDWSQVGCGANRAVADISADADPWTGMAVYDSTPSPYGSGWITVGGTSLSSPIIAAAFALAGGADGVEYPAQTLYSHLGSSSLHDITTGTNWGCSKYDEYGFPDCTPAEYEANCSGELICNAAPGYDGPTGVGTPDGLGAFRVGSNASPPTVTSVTPNEGAPGGGASVTITGTNLSKASSVHFGSTSATIAEDTASSITAISPEHEPGTVDVTVTTFGGTSSVDSTSDDFTYISPEVPVSPGSPKAPGSPESGSPESPLSPGSPVAPIPVPSSPSSAPALVPRSAPVLSLGVPGASSSNTPRALALSDVSLATSSFLAGARPRLRATLSQAATLVVSIGQTLTGRIARGRCIHTAKRGRRCAALAHDVTLELPARSGADTLGLNIPSLKAGRYTATVTARGAAGLTSRAVTLGFAIKPK